MKSGINILKGVVLTFLILTLFIMFMPMFKETYGDRTTKFYIYSSGFGIIQLTPFFYPLIASIFGVLLYFSKFKNKDIFSTGLLMFAAMFYIYILLSINQSIKDAGDDDIKRTVGFYFAQIFAWGLLLSTLAHFILCKVQERITVKLKTENIE